MTTTDQHAVFATFADGTKVRVTAWVSWTDAIDTWTAMDDQRRDARVSKGIVTYRGMEIRHYEVRSAQDPQYCNRIFVNLARGFAVYSRSYTTEQAAAKAVLKPLGYYSKAGGWIYYRDQHGAERVLIQGWWQAAQATGHFVSSLKGETGHRAAVTTMLQVSKKAVA